jgi:hypothetical protein
LRNLKFWTKISTRASRDGVAIQSACVRGWREQRLLGCLRKISCRMTKSIAEWQSLYQNAINLIAHFIYRMISFQTIHAQYPPPPEIISETLWTIAA